MQATTLPLSVPGRDKYGGVGGRRGNPPGRTGTDEDLEHASTNLRLNDCDLMTVSEKDRLANRTMHSIQIKSFIFPKNSKMNYVN